MSFASNPIRRATRTSFAFARSLKSDRKVWLMTFWPRPSIAAHEPLFRGAPQDDGRRDREGRSSSGDDGSCRFLLVCLQSTWPIQPNRRRSAPRPAVSPLPRSLRDGAATNQGPAALLLVAEDCHRRN